MRLQMQPQVLLGVDQVACLADQASWWIHMKNFSTYLMGFITSYLSGKTNGGDNESGEWFQTDGMVQN